MYRLFIFIPLLFFFTACGGGNDSNDSASNTETEDNPVPLENPVNVQYLKKHLKNNNPKLILNPSIARKIKKKVKSEPVAKNFYQAIKLNAKKIQNQPLITRNVIGRRMLRTSQEMLYRMNILGIVYKINHDEQLLKRINEELITVSNFKDWNPSHFLDVAEMSMAVALAIDWAGEDLPASTVELAKNALIEKGIKPSYKDGNNWWVDAHNNWNQVCHGGMIAAAIMTADKNPELAAKTISRSLDSMPYALQQYGPDGVYPEGATYWSYGTSYTVLTASILESAFGTDFGIAKYPAFMESAVFKLLSLAPSGWYYNFADCRDKRGKNGDLTLAWFAAKTGSSNYFERERFLQDPESMRKLSRYAGAGLVWLSQFKPSGAEELPLAWKGEGDNPIVIFRGGENDPRQYYFGGKGGKATISHGNMDAGSFIFELDGVRWVIDPGKQSYHELEKMNFDLWSMCQDCDRWTLLTKNNYGHSTLTVNDKLFVNDGVASLENFEKDYRPTATFNMTQIFGNNLASAERTFTKDDPSSLLIQDKVEISNETELITWQLMTQAKVFPTSNGAVLEQYGKQLNLTILEPQDLKISVVSLDPPPMKFDKRIENLKRIEIKIPAYTLGNGRGLIRVRLSGE